MQKSPRQESIPQLLTQLIGATAKSTKRMFGVKSVHRVCGCAEGFRSLQPLLQKGGHWHLLSSTLPSQTARRMYHHAIDTHYFTKLVLVLGFRNVKPQARVHLIIV
jgi:hypothetical protein